MWPCFCWGFLQTEPVAQIPLAGGRSEIFFLEAAKEALEVGERDEEGEELPCGAEVESMRDAQSRQAVSQEEVVVTPVCSRRTGE